MINLLIAILGSLISGIFTLLSKKVLFSYTIVKLGSLKNLLINTFDLLTKESPGRGRILLFSFAAICSIAISIAIIYFLIMSFNEFYSESTIMRIIIPLWVLALIFNCLVAIYYIMFFIIFLLALVLLFVALASYAGKSGGGPVHVRGHFRNGSYVRSYNRRRPKKF